MHVMDYVGVRDGLDAWVCPECGRALGFSRERVEYFLQGDDTVPHVGSKGGLAVTRVEAEQDPWTDSDLADLAALGIIPPGTDGGG